MKSETYCMDCMEYMRKLPDKAFELAIVDPPYGGNDAIGIENNIEQKKQLATRKKYKIFKNKEPEKYYFDELFRVSKNQIIWGANFYTTINLSGGRIVWNKHGTCFGEAEEAFCSMQKSISVFDYTWNGMLQQDMKNKEVRIHPTQKPVALYKWLLAHYAHAGDRILDTHLGSGSSRIAAYDMGFDFVGIELDNDYFLAEEKRFNDYKSQLTLFDNAQLTKMQEVHA